MWFHVLSSLFFLAFFTPVVAELDPYNDDAKYDAASYGLYPINTYVSTDVASPRLNIIQTSEECRNDLYWVFGPRGSAVSEPSAMILDSEGSLVWTKGGYDQVYNLQVQEYRGEKYLTFWSGSDAVQGHGAGIYHMLDKTYKEVHTVVAANGLAGDLHDFIITENGTALITIYDVVRTEMSYGGLDSGYVWDCVVQEIDLGTGELLFEWRAAHHFAVSDTYREMPEGNGGVNSAFDFFHINSIDKDEYGNFLVSSRYLHCLTYINGTTGGVIWILGGKRNMFTDLSNGQATNFAYQHDARWRHNRTAISMFDNAGDDVHREAISRGLLLEIDEVNMTVRVLQAYINPKGISGLSQGNMQMLDDGHVILGYGNTPTMTEYAPNGTALCDNHFGPESRFGAGEVQSYRIFKFDWHGYPTTDPDVRILTNDEDWISLYVSWNGATEVTRWLLQGTDDPEPSADQWVTLDYADKISFETEFQIPDTYPNYLRVKALADMGTDEGENHVLGVSDALDVELEKIWSLKPLRLEGQSGFPLLVLIGFAGLMGLAVGLREAINARRRRRLPSLLRWRPRSLGVPLLNT